MTTRSPFCTVRVAGIVMLIALIGMAAALMPDAAAEPIVVTTSVPTRIDAQRDLCEIAGGGKLEVSVTFTTATATTTCKGGTEDGWTCVNTPSYTDCSKALTSPTDVPNVGPPDTAENVAQTAIPTSPDHPAAPPPGEAEEPAWYDPQATYGELIDPRADLVIAMCRRLGGGETASISAGPDGATRIDIDTVACQGGMVDTLGCDFVEPAVWCALGIEELPDDDAAQPTGAVVLPAEVPQIALPESTDAAVRPEVAEDPTMGGDVVVYNQQGSTVSDNAIAQAGLCELLGGTASTAVKRTGGGIEWIDVDCRGGLLDGMYCVNDQVSPSRCFRALVQATEEPMVTPVPAREQPVEMTPTPAATAMPSPTTVPTIELVEATAVPTQDLADPKNDNNVPPGQAEDPIQPPPTEAPLR